MRHSMKPDLRADYKIRLYTGPQTPFFEVSIFDDVLNNGARGAGIISLHLGIVTLKRGVFLTRRCSLFWPLAFAFMALFSPELSCWRLLCGPF